MRDKVEDMKNKIFILRSFIADDGSRVAKPVYIFFFSIMYLSQLIMIIILIILKCFITVVYSR